MLANPSAQYRSFAPVGLKNRSWPDAVITQPPVWMSTDLRDGNQALFEPLNPQQKLRMFAMLCRIGFKEIEVAFPSASQTDFDFVRTLIEGGHIPEDVTIEVLTQAREPLIRRTMEALKGARRAIVHIYTPIAPVFRENVLGVSKQQLVDMAVSSVRLVKELAEQEPQTEWMLEYSPETFSMAELDFSLEISNAVTRAWEASPDRKIILNLPATVEAATPNIYADQIEWMHTRLENRKSIILSVHPHNDRGTAVAAAELAVMAGAQRVEGCLFGNGERTGNVDLVTLAMNLYTQGVSPGLDFGQMDEIVRTVEHYTQLPVHPRHPYAGDLVFTAFSGSHQDAIKKGFSSQSPEALWNVPYLPVNPHDLGRSYESIIRVNSQSGKGGIAYLLETESGIVLPRRLQIDFAGKVQAYTDAHGGEISASTIKELFFSTYLETQSPLHYQTHRLFQRDGRQGIELSLILDGQPQQFAGTGNGPIDAAVNALSRLGIVFSVRSYEERSIDASKNGGDAQACAFVEIAHRKTASYGVGLDDNIVTASIKALVNAVNRLEDLVISEQAIASGA